MAPKINFQQSCQLLQILLFFALMISTSGYLKRQGKEFIIAFYRTKYLKSAGIVFTPVEQTADVNVRVSAPLLQNVSHLRFDSLDSGRFLRISKDVIQGEISSTRNGVLIRSSHDIIVEGYVVAKENIGGFLAIPVSSLGSRYMLITYCPNHNCFFVIVGTSKKTEIQINLRIKNKGFASVHGRRYLDRKKVVLKLNKFETIEGFSSSELSGTEIVASHPVAVFCGGDYIKAIIKWGDNGHDQIVEQVPPVSALGTRYIPQIFPFLRGAHGVVFLLKVVSVYDDTVIRLMKKCIQLSKGKSEEFLLSSSSSNMLDGVSSSKPVLVAAISPSWPAFKHAYGKRYNDASMIIFEPLNMLEPFQSQIVSSHRAALASTVNHVFLRPASCHKEALTKKFADREISKLRNSQWEVRVLYGVSRFTLVSTSRCPVMDGFLYTTQYHAGGAAGLPLVRVTRSQDDPGHSQNFMELCPHVASQLLHWILPSHAQVDIRQMLTEIQ